jgi:hypothetical protein
MKVEGYRALVFHEVLEIQIEFVSKGTTLTSKELLMGGV